MVGITDFAPMDYRTGDDWTGFDADLAKAFAQSIGVTAKFVEIDWDKKTDLLEQGTIDCIWNGMTQTDELKKTISCSEPYLSNSQVVVMQNSQVEKYSTVESCQHMLFAVENSSAGETLIKKMKYRYKDYGTQKEALESVSDKKADAAVIDIIMASYYTDNEQKFEKLGFDIALNDEKICIGLRNGSDLTEKVNDFLKSAYEDGTIKTLAEQYGIENAILD